MATQEEIAQQQELLKMHRGNLARYLRQEAAQGGEIYVSPSVANSILATRRDIQRVKNILRSWDVPVEDHPDDFESGALPAAPAQTQDASTSVRACPPTTRLKSQRKRTVQMRGTKKQSTVPITSRKQEPAVARKSRRKHTRPTGQTTRDTDSQPPAAHDPPVDLIDRLVDSLIRRLEEELRMNKSFWNETDFKKPRDHEIHIAIFFDRQIGKLRQLHGRTRELAQQIEDDGHISRPSSIAVETLLIQVDTWMAPIFRSLAIIADHPLSISISQATLNVESCAEQARDALIQDDDEQSLSERLHFLAVSLEELEDWLRRLVDVVAQMLAADPSNRDVLLSSDVPMYPPYQN